MYNMRKDNVKKINIILIKAGDVYNDPRIIKEMSSFKKFGFYTNILAWKRKKSTPNVLETNNKETVMHFPFIAKDDINSIFLWPIWWIYLFIIIITKKSDLIHVINYNSIFPALIAGKIKRIPVIYEILDTTYEDINISPLIKSIIRSIDRIFMKYSDAVVVVDELQIRQFGGIPNSNICILYDSAIDVSRKNVIPKIEKKYNELLLVYIGVLNKSRRLNIDKLCYAVQSIEGVKLVIAGYGDLVNEIKSWAQMSHGKITFIGMIEYTKALELSMESDVLLVLRDSSVRSNRFICGSKIWEAMMCGKPILVNRGTSTAEKVMKVNCGLIINANNTEEISKAIIKLKDNRILCKELGTNARKAYEERYSWEHMENKLYDLYINLLC